MTDNAKTIPISIAYAPTPEEQRYLKLNVPQGTRVGDVIIMTGWLDDDEELRKWFEANRHALKVDKRAWRVGIFSHKVLLSEVVRADDRIEVYRPLTLDPMQQRQNRLQSRQKQSN